jgi:4'-phosphopantetheinyl transferase
LVAVTSGGEVGIDVERVRPMPDALRLAERFFSTAESDVLKELPPPEQGAAFLNLWTRKEALAKATGLGITNSLTRFEVAMGAEAVVQAIDGDARLAAQWTLRSFKPAPGYLAAAAVRSPAAQFVFHEFTTAN